MAKALKQYGNDKSLKENALEFVNMRKANYSLKQIAEELNVSVWSVKKLRRYVELTIDDKAELPIPDHICAPNATIKDIKYEKHKQLEKAFLTFDERLKVLTQLALNGTLKPMDRIQAVRAMTELCGDARRETDASGATRTVLKFEDPISVTTNTKDERPVEKEKEKKKKKEEKGVSIDSIDSIDSNNSSTICDAGLFDDDDFDADNVGVIEGDGQMKISLEVDDNMKELNDDLV